MITAECICSFGMRNVVEALRLLPGIHQSWYPNGYPNLRVRGFSSLPSNNVLFLLDGILQTGLFDGDQIAVVGTLPLGASERIEVTPGAGSSMFGADAFSAVVNVVTRRKAQGVGDDSDFGTQVSPPGRTRLDAAAGMDREAPLRRGLPGADAARNQPLSGPHLPAHTGSEGRTPAHP